jgi:hypothetical protein
VNIPRGAVYPNFARKEVMVINRLYWRNITDNFAISQGKEEFLENNVRGDNIVSTGG